MMPGDDFYMGAFWDLSTCRDQGHALGPIPWRDILAYGQFTQLEPDILDSFIQIIRQMDVGYLQWHAGEQKRKSGTEDRSEAPNRTTARTTRWAN